MNSILVTNIICPRCHAELESHLEVCPSCGGSVSDPQRLPSARIEPSVLDRPWVIAVLLLHVGLFGIPIYWRTRHSVLARIVICLLSVAYTFLAIGFIVVVGSSIYRRLTGG